MKWVKYAVDTKSAKAGESVQLEDAAAKTLIDAGFADETTAPKEVTDAATELKGSLADFVKTAVSDGFDALRAEFKTTQRNPVAGAGGDNGYELGTAGKWVLPATVKRYGSLRSFKGTDAHGRSAEQRAYEHGMWYLANIQGRGSKTWKWCEEKGFGFQQDVSGKVSRENNNTSSGFLVPDQFENDLIDLRETFGVFRQLAKIIPMTSDTRSDPRRTGGLTAYFVGESTAPTTSDKTWDRVRLTAKKVGVLTKYTNELGEDAVLNIGDDLAHEIAYAFSALEDDCGLNGDGTSAYGGIVGWRNAINNVASNAGIQAASGTGYATNWNSIVLADFNNLLGKLPQYAFQSGNVNWVASQAFYGSVMQRLALAAGGNAVPNIVDGVPQMTFLGYPVKISQKMPTTSATSAIPVLFGNLREGCRFGDRRGTSIKMSQEALNTFEQDETAIVGFERFDIVCHDVGTATVAGPVVALKTASS